MLRWLKSLQGRQTLRPRRIPDALWQGTLDNFPFLSDPGEPGAPALKSLVRLFLQQKEFYGAAGLQITDEMAIAIAAQACRPVLHLERPYRGLQWYDDFVGIVVHPDAMLARRETTDDAGVVHHYQEVVTGEAMQDGPVTLSWRDVQDAGHSAHSGYNVVIHEFVHKIDMRDGSADGCPPLPDGFMGASTVAQARRLWVATLQTQHEEFCDKLSIAERFGGAQPWLDPYAAHSIDEFFAVVCEAYFVNPGFLARDFAALVPMFDAFFKQAPG